MVEEELIIQNDNDNSLTAHKDLYSQEMKGREKSHKFRRICIYAIMYISAVLSGILLIPAGIIFLFIFFIWKIADKIIRLLEGKA